MLASETRQEMESYFESRLQRDFNEGDRRELAIWMRDVCQAEECQADIFPLSIQIVDKFLTFVRTKRSQLQLLGAVALLLASKLRQTRQIPAKHLIYYTQDLITLNELKTWELFVLTTLKWDLALITPVDYLDILIKRMKLDDEQLIGEIEDETLRLIHQSCLNYDCSLCPPSMIAWACLMQAIDSWKLNSHQLLPIEFRHCERSSPRLAWARHAHQLGAHPTSNSSSHNHYLTHLHQHQHHHKEALGYPHQHQHQLQHQQRPSAKVEMVSVSCDHLTHQTGGCKCQRVASAACWQPMLMVPSASNNALTRV